MADEHNCGDAIVVVSGYEAGIEALESIRLVELIKREDKDPLSGDNMFGEYDLRNNLEYLYANQKPVTAVYFPRRHPND